MHIGIEAAITNIRLGILILDDLNPRIGPEIDARWDKAREAVIERFSPEILTEDERIMAARRMLWENGVDPVLSPPSCERLIRRVLRDEAFPSVHPFTQRGWIAAMDMVLPFSVFDRDRLPDSVTLRRGKGGEGYLGVLGEGFRTDRSLTFYDKYFRPFGGPEGDSVDTAPRETTRSLLIVFYSGDLFSAQALQVYLDRVEHLFTDIFGGACAVRRIVGDG